MPKNVQTTRQLHSFHMLARFCSKLFKLGFNSVCTKNFQMHRMDLEKAEEPCHLADKDLDSQSYVFFMYEGESWTMKKAELQRIDAFKMSCWRRRLRVPWTEEIKPVNPKGNQP